MNKKTIIFIMSIIIVIGVIICIFLLSDKKDFYTMKDDNIKKITSVVGKRKLLKKTKTKNGDTIIKTYKYINIDDPYNDLSKYINYLEEKSTFIPTNSFNLENKIGEIQISRYSTNKEYIIIMDISYNADSYTIKITRGKGKITPLNNF
ncbi:MAG: hypothetical protein J6O56_03550 [Bacilli bacterium]|nr:hypothetical protein [Bacilli bacterium]